MGPETAPLRAVFDTNIVVSALVFGGVVARLRGAWASGKLTPVICQETVLELLEVMSYPKFKLSAPSRDALLQDYLPFGEIVVLPVPLPALPVACRDVDDDLFLHLALAAGADALVTGDQDLLALRDNAPMRILTFRDLQLRGS